MRCLALYILQLKLGNHLINPSIDFKNRFLAFQCAEYLQMLTYSKFSKQNIMLWTNTETLSQSSTVSEDIVAVHNGTA